MEKLTRQLTNVFRVSSKRDSEYNTQSVSDEVAPIKQSISLRFSNAKNGMKNRVIQMARLRQKIKSNGNRNSDKPESSLKNNEGFALQRSQTTSSVVLQKGWKILMDKTAKLAHNLKENISHHRRMSEGKSQASSRMDPQTRDAYKVLKHYGHANSLEDAQIILETMRTHEKIPEIQALGCHYLAKLALQEGEGLVAYGSIEVLAKAMDNFPSNSRVQENACMLVWNLAIEDVLKLKLASQHVPERLVKVMDNFQRETTVLHMACGAMKLLASDEEAKRVMVEKGAIELLIKCFQKFCKDDPNEPEYQETCISCVQNFAHGKLYLDKLLEVKAPHYVIRSMRKFEQNNVVQSAGCAAIWNLSIPEKFKMPLAELGAANRCLQALRIFHDDSDVVVHAMGALKNLTNTVECFEYVRKKAHNGEIGSINIYDVIYDAFVVHQENDANIRRIGEDLLFSFDIEDEENLNREHRKSKEDDNSVNGAETGVRSSSRSQNMSKKTRSGNDKGSSVDFGKDFDLGNIEDDHDLEKDFALSEIPKSKKLSVHSKRDKKISKASEYDPDDPFANLAETGHGDAAIEEDDFELGL